MGPCDFLSPRNYKEACAAEKCGFKGASNGVFTDVASMVQLNVRQSSSITLVDNYELAAEGRSMESPHVCTENCNQQFDIRIISRNTLVACQRYPRLPEFHVL